MNTAMFWDRMEERFAETVDALKRGKNPSIIRFSVHITNNCNLNCAFCNDNHGGLTMPRSLFREICKRAGKKGIVHITGGEPMTVPWLEDEIENNRNITRFALNTNMVILPRPSTLQAIFRLKMSLDNYEYSGKREHFSAKIIENIRTAIKQVKYSSICYTATHENASRLEKFIAFCGVEFPQLHSLSISFYKGSNPSLKLTSDDLHLLFAASNKLNPVSREIFRETHKVTGNNFPDNLNTPCYLSLTERLFDECGREFFCSHLYRDHVQPPGTPGKDVHCVSGCNARFQSFNKKVADSLKDDKH